MEMRPIVPCAVSPCAEAFSAALLEYLEAEEALREVKGLPSADRTVQGRQAHRNKTLNVLYALVNNKPQRLCETKID